MDIGKGKQSQDEHESEKDESHAVSDDLSF